MTDEDELSRRWRLVLGPDSEPSAGRSSLSGVDEQIDQALGFLFDREHGTSGGHRRDRTGTAGGSSLNVPTWLARVRELFPRSTAESLTKTALERYRLTEILADEKTFEQIEPNIDLLRALLSVKSILPPRLLEAVRKVVRRVVRELREPLERQVRRHFGGGADRRHPSSFKLARNFDVVRTLRKNLKHFDPARRELLLERPFFFSRIRRQHPWDLFLLVDQSGSMVDSVIHSAVLAGIFQSLPMLKTRLIAFDTSVVDLTDQIGDPVELLLSVQLGGGTDIGQAMRYVEPLVARPKQTMVVLITDFYEGAHPDVLLDQTARLVQHGATLLGLAALDDRSEPAYDKNLARQLASRGMKIGAMTPDRLAEWVAEHIRR